MFSDIIWFAAEKTDNKRATALFQAMVVAINKVFAHNWSVVIEEGDSNSIFIENLDGEGPSGARVKKRALQAKKTQV